MLMKVQTVSQKGTEDVLDTREGPLSNQIGETSWWRCFEPASNNMGCVQSSRQPCTSDTILKEFHISTSTRRIAIPQYQGAPQEEDMFYVWCLLQVLPQRIVHFQVDRASFGVVRIDKDTMTNCRSEIVASTLVLHNWEDVCQQRDRVGRVLPEHPSPLLITSVSASLATATWSAVTPPAET